MLPIAVFHAHPPLFIEGHAGGRYYVMRYVHGHYEEQDGLLPADATFSTGPAMRYATVDRRRVKVFHQGRVLGNWRLRNARVVTWWDLPMVARGHRVDLLLSGGCLRRLPLDGKDLVAALPGRSGALFALYSTKSHWRVLRRGRGDDRWTAWMPGRARDFAPTRTRLFVATGRSAGGYDEYGAAGPGVLWSYGYRRGDLVRHRVLPKVAALVFDHRWVGDHLASVMKFPPEDDAQKSWLPLGTEVLRLSGTVSTLAKVSGGWEVYAYDGAKRRLLGLHINRGNMGFDLSWLPIEPRKKEAADDEVGTTVDVVHVSTASPYSPLVGE